MSAESPAVRVPLAIRLTVMIAVLFAAGSALAFKVRQWRSEDISVVTSKPLQVQPAPPERHLAAGSTERDQHGAGCGVENGPDCPLQRWMDEEINNSFTTRNARQLATAFRFLAKIAPPAYPDWAAWAEGGVAAATKGDFALAKRACAGCHNDYRERYRTEMRSRALPVEDTSSSRPGARN
jgi:hypothetical protein